MKIPLICMRSSRVVFVITFSANSELFFQEMNDLLSSLEPQIDCISAPVFRKFYFCASGPKQKPGINESCLNAVTEEFVAASAALSTGIVHIIIQITLYLYYPFITSCCANYQLRIAWTLNCIEIPTLTKTFWLLFSWVCVKIPAWSQFSCSACVLLHVMICCEFFSPLFQICQRDLIF